MLLFTRYAGCINANSGMRFGKPTPKTRRGAVPRCSYVSRSLRTLTSFRHQQAFRISCVELEAAVSAFAIGRVTPQLSHRILALSPVGPPALKMRDGEPFLQPHSLSVCPSFVFRGSNRGISSYVSARYRSLCLIVDRRHSSRLATSTARKLP